MKNLLVFLIAAIAAQAVNAQACTPAGNQTSYGSSDVWIGYLYDNTDFTNYKGYVNEGISGNPNFDEGFGGDQVNYATNGCPLYTESFSARYKLTKTFASGNYQFTVGADDGYRLSIDGGATWIINRWNDQSYAYTSYSLSLGGTYNMVIEYYENGGGNRLTFSVRSVCAPGGDPALYGTGNTWNGYLYQGNSFNSYFGAVTEGTAGNPGFDESFGGNNTLYATSGCSITTENFSARYRLNKTFAANTYLITVGGDDGYRLSMDGGSTWIINHWNDQSYTTTTYSAALSGNYNMVLEYYENGGENRLSFTAIPNALLPVELLTFGGKPMGAGIFLNWSVTREVNTDYYIVEKSSNGTDFSAMGRTPATSAGSTEKLYSFTDATPVNGSNYYRLRMVDKDGKIAFSKVISLLFDQQKTIHIYPSVTSNNTVYLGITTELKNAVVGVFDLNGRKLKQIKLPALCAAGQAISLLLPTITKGNYVLTCVSGGQVMAKQIILIQ